MYNIIGIDGGGTSTRCVLTNQNLEVMCEFSGGASNPITCGFANSAEIIFRLIKKVCYKSGVKKNIFIAAGIAGCGSKINSERLKKLLLQKLNVSKISFLDLKIVGDAQIALEGALNGRSGVILIAGTGSVLFGKNNSGKLFKIGGYGKLIGDEGSGYSIGRKGLEAASKYFDGRGYKTKLAEYLAREHRITNRDEMIKKVYSGSFDAAAVSKLVLKAANNGDIICRKILHTEINELLLHIKASREKIGTKKYILSFAGSLLTNNNYYSRELKRKIIDSFKGIKLVKAKYPPVMGAAIIAEKLLTGKIK